MSMSLGLSRCSPASSKLQRVGGGGEDWGRDCGTIPYGRSCQEKLGVSSSWRVSATATCRPQGPRTGGCAGRIAADNPSAPATVACLLLAAASCSLLAACCMLLAACCLLLACCKLRDPPLRGQKPHRNTAIRDVVDSGQLSMPRLSPAASPRLRGHHGHHRRCRASGW